ncbi:MAG: hypothetical protein ACRDRH_06905 [Pseudonocardia sp.]
MLDQRNPDRLRPARAHVVADHLQRRQHALLARGHAHPGGDRLPRRQQQVFSIMWHDNAPQRRCLVFPVRPYTPPVARMTANERPDEIAELLAICEDCGPTNE